MKRITFLLTTATIISIILLNSIIAFSTPITQAASTSGTQWQLSVNGLVTNPLNLTLTDLVAMPQTTVEANIYCVDFPDVVVTGGKWTGVTLRYLFEEAGVLPSAIKVAFYAADGYSTDLDLETATRENIILAYKKDGEQLSETLRLVVPGKWGYKWISQVTGIVLVDYDFKGKWESQGYSDDGNIQLGGTSPPATELQPTFSSPTPNQPSEPTAPASPPATQPSDSSSSAPSGQTQNPKVEAVPQNPELFPATWIVLAVAVAILSTCVLVYAKKRHQKL